jgi:hypothetical protein
MKSKNLNLKIAIACTAIGWLCWTAGNVCTAQNSAPGLSPDLQEVVKLSQAKMPDDVIRNYINSTGRSYRLSADDIVYLSSQGVSSGVISALQTTSSAAPTPQPAPAPTAPPPPAPTPAAYGNVPPPDAGGAPDAVQPTPPPPPEVDFNYFHDQLAPYGSWINVGGVMYWRPDQAMAVNPDWRPYYDMGQWVQTDNGLYWQSDYTWGDIPFHYGRWVLQPGIGWVWAPDYTWGPAWVFWRQDEGDAAIGWAPLPVGAVYVNGAFMFNGVAVGADFDFGLGFGCFTFVGYDHFHEGFFRMRGHEWAYHIDRERLHSFYGRSVIRNDFRRDEHGRFVNDGIGRDRVEHLTHVEHAKFEERNPVGDRNKLANTRTEEFHKQGAGGTAGPGHGSTGNFGGDRNAKTTGENKTFNEQKSGTGHTTSASPTSGSSVSKVYRPPTSGGMGGASQQHQSQQHPSGQGDKKK